ncbi:MAG: hypothetical protein NZM10_03725 [Fimbriimonadales bacterium]|nr:hypothetical protein [Fimbriimonadales bacterium]
MTTRALLLCVAEGFEGVQAGRNGPWGYPETRVRNAAHWLNLLAWAYQQTGQNLYRQQVCELAEYLLSDEARPHGKGFVCFEWHYTERGNGLVGQGWGIEALITASAALQTPVYAELAQQLWLAHPFEESLGLWHAVEPDGRIGAVHPTLNQQVWFAAIGLLLPPPRPREVDERVRQFLDGIGDHLEVAPSGRLGVQIPLGRRDIRWHWERFAPALRAWTGRLLRRSRLYPEFTYRERSVGYHAFTLYGFALLKLHLPHHPFWESQSLRRALQWLRSEAHRRALRRNPFAMGYNPAGFEVPFVLSVFMPDWTPALLNECRWWLSEQAQRHYNPDTRRFDRNTVDPATLTARAYEATRLPDALLDLPLH